MLRRLSNVEYGMVMASQWGPMQFSTTARIRGDFSLAELHAALTKVRQKHPLLAVRIVQDADGQPWFTQDGVPDFPLRIIENAKEDEWMPVLAEELLRPFVCETGPLVRFVWLKGSDWSDLIALSHHAISDGLAGAYLMRDLLHHLGNPDAPVEPLPLLPPIHELIPPEVEATLSKMPIPDLLALSSFSSAQDKKPGLVDKSTTRLIFALLKSPAGPTIGRLMRWTAVRKSRHTPATAASAGLPRLCLSAWSLDRAQTAALATRSKQEGTTVHAALGAAFLLAFAQVIGAGQWRRTIQSPVNLRKHLSPPVGEDFGVFMTLAKTTVDCSPGRDFWDIAHDIKEGFNRQTTPERLFAMYGLMKALSTLAGGALLETMGQAFSSLDYDLSLSNIGRLDIPTTYGSLQLESLYGPTFSAIGDRIVGVNTTGGRMFFTLIAQETIMDAATGARVREIAMHRLGEAVGW